MGRDSDGASGHVNGRLVQTRLDVAMRLTTIPRRRLAAVDSPIKTVGIPVGGMVRPGTCHLRPTNVAGASLTI